MLPKKTSNIDNFNQLKDLNWADILGIVLVAYAMLMSGVWSPNEFGYILDESFQVVLHEIFRTDIQFGRDFIYTYGPYGILQTSKAFPDTYAYLLGGRLLIGMSFAVGLWKLILHCWSKDKFSVIFFLPFSAFFLNSGMEANAFYFMILTLPLLIYFHVNEGKISPVLVLIIVLSALVGLIKQTYLSLSVVFMVLIGVDEVFRQRRPPLVLGLYLIFTLVFWILAGQNPLNIPGYLVNGSEIVKGFGATMGTPGPPAHIYAYLFSMGTFSLLILATVWKSRSRFHLLPVLGLIVFSFVVFKASFIRHDAYHATLSPHVTVPVACLFTALLWPDIVKSGITIKKLRIYIPFILLSWILILISAYTIFGYYDATGRSYGQYYIQNFTRIGDSIEGLFKLITRRTNIGNIYDGSLNNIRSSNPMPVMSGKADLYSNETAVIFAQGLPYQPRPIIQSFAAYTGKLARLNRDHLNSSHAPETILFNMDEIDQRLPSSEDGLSWPELLTRYDITDGRNKFLVLKRTPSPRAYALLPIKEQTVKMGEWIELPNSDSDPLWMRVNIAPTTMGKLTASLLKLPPLFIEVQNRDDVVEKYRVLPDIMGAGQLLSPLIKDTGDFLFLASPRWKEVLKYSRIKKMRLVTGKEDAFAYEKSYSLSLSRLDFPRQDFADVLGWSDPYTEDFNFLGADNAFDNGGKWIKSPNATSGKLILFAHSPARIEGVVPAGAKNLSIGYGIMDGAWQENDKNPVVPGPDGVEFRVLAVNADGKEEIIFSKLLNPFTNPADRGTQKTEIDLTLTNAKKIILETRPRQNTNWDWSYWSQAMIQ
ncbi:MAG: hypothetical protein N5P05_001461 [Chroococcopsis gigantea SAG 12.99]|jgi:hypothetical protein|nr:hypothetical protein [Chlorogloea purpurea SAG 13.99]MDV2999855.1 hypothetical protein [Chroococcopsis gigantea SAG 12.99]